MNQIAQPEEESEDLEYTGMVEEYHMIQEDDSPKDEPMDPKSAMMRLQSKNVDLQLKEAEEAYKAKLEEHRKESAKRAKEKQAALDLQTKMAKLEEWNIKFAKLD